jgi:hypothetical protein
MLRNLSSSIFAETDALVEHVAPVLRGQDRSPLVNESLSDLLLQRGAKSFARLALINDFAKTAALAGALERAHVRAAYSGNAKRLNSAGKKAREFLEDARPVYQRLLVRYRSDDKGRFNSDAAAFWGRYFADENPFGFRSPDTWELGAAICEVADIRFHQSNCKEYFATRARIFNAILSPAARGGDQAKLILAEESRAAEQADRRVNLGQSQSRHEAERENSPKLESSEAAKSKDDTSDDREARDRLLAEAMEQIEQLEDFPDVQRELKRFEAVLRVQLERGRVGLPRSRHMLHFIFNEQSETVKTLLITIISKVLHGHGILSRGQIIDPDGEGIVAEYIGGQTAIRMEDLRDRLVIVAHPFPGWISEFFDGELGLEVHEMPFYQYASRSLQELCAIFDRMAFKELYLISSDARERLKRVLKRRFHDRQDQFSELREIFNFYQEVVIRQALRLAVSPSKPDAYSLRLLEKADIPLERELRAATPRALGNGYLWVSCARAIEEGGVALSVSVRIRERHVGRASDLGRNRARKVPPQPPSLVGLNLRRLVPVPKSKILPGPRGNGK